MPTAPVGSAADQYAGRVTSIDGWIWPLSAAPGERVDLHVGTVSGVRYRVEFYRLGWYGGAGARLISCLPSCSGDQAGVSQPLPPAPDPATGMVRPSWSTTDSFTVPVRLAERDLYGGAPDHLGHGCGRPSAGCRS